MNIKLQSKLKERDTENAKLEYRIKHLLLAVQEGDKAEYRVKHLLRALEEEERKTKA
jgi:flagellar motor component MotA